MMIETTRPRAAAYQVCRFVDGPKVVFSCTRKGVVSMWRLRLKTSGKGGLASAVEVCERIKDADEQREAMERVIAAGYDVVAISDSLRKNAQGKRA